MNDVSLARVLQGNHIGIDVPGTLTDMVCRFDQGTTRTSRELAPIGKGGVAMRISATCSDDTTDCKVPGLTARSCQRNPRWT